MATYADAFGKIMRKIGGIFLILFGVVCFGGVVVPIVVWFDMLAGLAGPILVVASAYFIHRGLGLAFLNHIYVPTGSYRISGNYAYPERDALETSKFLKGKALVGFVSAGVCMALALINFIFIFVEPIKLSFISVKSLGIGFYIDFIVYDIAFALFMYFVIGRDSYNKKAEKW